MSYDYDDTDDGPVRVLWGKVGVFLAAGLLLFLLGRQCAPDGADPVQLEAAQARASEFEQRALTAEQQLRQPGTSSEPGGDGESESTGDGSDSSSEGDTGDSSEDPTDEDSESSSGENSGDTYTVEAGDTLNEIAAQFDVDPEDLADANGIEDPGDLVVGQELEIP